MTTVTPLSRILDLARISLPGSIDTMIKSVLFDVATEFTQKSDIWQEEIPFTVVAGQTDYEIDPSDRATINRLMYVENGDGIPTAATMREPHTVVLPTEPSQEAEYTATVALAPKDPVTSDGTPSLPTWIIEKYRLELLAGVLGQMMAQPAKPYSSDQKAVYHLRRFRTGIARAQVEARAMNVHSGQRWRFPKNFA